MKPVILLRRDQVDNFVVNFPSEYAQFDLLLDQDDLLITRLKIPIVAEAGAFMERKDGSLDVRGTDQKVTQFVYVAQHKEEALVSMGFVSSAYNNANEREQALKRALLDGIRSHWGLLRREAVG